MPAYVVEGASDDVLRLIFKRVNTAGVPMEESEVFGALDGDRDPHPIESACARLANEPMMATQVDGDRPAIAELIRRADLYATTP